MSAKYEPGTVAMVTWDNASQADKARGKSAPRTEQAMRTGDDKWSLVSAWNFCLADRYVSDVRPLVVLDLDKVYACDAERDPAAVVRYLRGTSSAVAFAIADQIEAQTRPPKPAEPTGLGAVVEDSAGRLFVRTASDVIPWLDADDTENGYDYADLDAVRVLSEGVQP